MQNILQVKRLFCKPLVISSNLITGSLLYIKRHPVTVGGVFWPNDEDAILRERPNVRFVTLESVSPLRITLSSRAGPSIDLTPFLIGP
jgi:hypothetical protein